MRGFDHATGAIGNRRPLYHVTQDGAFPDGMAMDGKAKLAGALGRMGVVRLDPETGEELARLELPVSQCPLCAFGGPNLMNCTSPAPAKTSVKRP